MSRQETIWAYLGLKVGGGLLGDPGDNLPFRPIVCSVDGCENRHAPEDDWTIYVLRNSAYEYRWGRLICSEHLQEEIELMLPGLFGASVVEIREAEPRDWVLAGDRVECLTGAS
jgi:hypothetical protein